MRDSSSDEEPEVYRTRAGRRVVPPQRLGIGSITHTEGSEEVFFDARDWV